MTKRATSVLFAVLALAAAAGERRATGLILPPRASSARRAALPGKPGLRLAAADPLPASWDSRDHGWVTPVKDQGGLGTCWAFASCAAMETQLLKSGRGEFDLSEKNMANLSGYEQSVDAGGNFDMAAAYLLRWGGAVMETNDVYASTAATWTGSPALAPAVHVQNLVLVPQMDGTDGTASGYKSAIREFGAVATTIKWSTYNESSNTYYNATGSTPDHAVTVIGWDDGFPGTAFRKTAPRDGAWLIKNSWGTDYGDGGYYWVSYCDASFGTLMDGVVFIIAEEDENYDVVRGYDSLGFIYDVSSTYPADELARYDLQASVFTSAWGEELAAVGVYSTVYPNAYEISVYTNVAKGASSPVEGGALACTQSGVLAHAGFTTIRLDAAIALADTNAFAVVYRQTGAERSTCVCCTYIDYAYPTNAPGNCYVGYATEAGTNAWLDAYYEADRVDKTDDGWAMCIKAYTRIAGGVPSSEVPAADENGASMMSDLKSEDWPWYLETSGVFGSAVGLVGANGRTMWTSWLSGLEWADPESRAFNASIDMSSGSPSVAWDPDLGGARTYTVYGRAELDDAAGWFEVDRDNPGATGAKFFKVTVRQ